MGYRPCGHKESDTSERLHFTEMKHLKTDQIELNFSMYHMLTPRSVLSQKEPDSLPEMSCKVQFLF